MKILIAHNYYQQPGGEDEVFACEAGLLEERGHQVTRYVTRNDTLQEMNKLQVAAVTLWNGKIHDEMSRLVHEQKPDVVHFHNTFPLMSPAAYYAAASRGAAIVQTLHNYRLICPAATLFREGKPCELCVGRTPWPAAIHGCYKASRSISAVASVMLSGHRAMGTWKNAVDVYIALTQFARSKFIEGGLPENRIAVKANFVHPDPGIGTGRGGYALFVGRLAEEKGVNTLLKAWSKLNGKLPLKIVGDGALRDEVKRVAASVPGVEYLGRRGLDEVLALMGEASVLVFPSTWYEGMPRTIVEAFAKGTPVLASDLGSMTEMITPDKTGWLFKAGDFDDLANRADELAADPSKAIGLRAAARKEYEQKYTADVNYHRLRSLYQDAVAIRAAKLEGLSSEVINRISGSTDKLPAA